MGAWGHKSFQNDSALNWLADVAEGDARLVGDALDAVTAAGAQIGTNDGSVALASAELVAAALGKGDDRLNEDAAAWLKDHRDAVRQIGAPRARRAVERVLESSELQALWDEDGVHAECPADVLELLKRLAAPSH